MSGLVDIFLSCHPEGLAPLFVSLFLSDSENTQAGFLEVGEGEVFSFSPLCVLYL
jgi:hypothetical protein